MRRALRRLLVRAAMALEEPSDLDIGVLEGGRLPAGEIDASLTTGEIQIRGRYWRISALAGQRVAVLAFYGDWDEAALAMGAVTGMAQIRDAMVASGAA